MDYSKMNLDQLNLSFEQINVTTLIKENLHFLKFIAKIRNIKILVEAECENLIINSDARRVKQIIVDLTYKLYKRTKEGHIKIKIQLIPDV